MSMLRKQVYIRKDQDETLKRLAQRLGVTEAEVVRRGIESMRRRETPEEEAPRVREQAVQYDTSLALPWSRADLYRGYARRLDDDAWEEELAFIEERARSLPEGGSTVKWRREDGYDKRRARIPD